jgi:hypothetical protein
MQRAEEATYAEQDAVKKDIEAMIPRIKRPAMNGAQRSVMRKTKADALCR